MADQRAGEFFKEPGKHNWRDGTRTSDGWDVCANGCGCERHCIWGHRYGDTPYITYRKHQELLGSRRPVCTPASPVLLGAMAYVREEMRRWR